MSLVAWNNLWFDKHLTVIFQLNPVVKYLRTVRKNCKRCECKDRHYWYYLIGPREIRITHFFAYRQKSNFVGKRHCIKAPKYSITIIYCRNGEFDQTLHYDSFINSLLIKKANRMHTHEFFVFLICEGIKKPIYIMILSIKLTHDQEMQLYYYLFISK